MLTIEPYIYKLFKNRAPELSAPTVVVAGLGRCGTTLLMDAIIRSRTIHYYSRYGSRNTRYYRHVAEGGETPKRKRKLRLLSFGHIVWSAKYSHVYKIHSYPFPDRPLPPHVRVIWMFGNPMMIAASLSNRFLHDPAKRKDFLLKHILNMETPCYKYHDDVLTRDIYMLERHFDTWHRPHAFPFLSVRYEAMERAEVRQAIADFVGFPLQFPRWEERRTKWRSHPQRAQLEAAYGRLHAKVEAAEDVKLWQPEAVRPEWQER